MFEHFSPEIAGEHINDLRREAAAARLIREARQGRSGEPRRTNWLRRRRAHGLVPA
jgi:hypothetical protein